MKPCKFFVLAGRSDGRAEAGNAHFMRSPCLPSDELTRFVPNDLPGSVQRVCGGEPDAKATIVGNDTDVIPAGKIGSS